MPTDTLKCPMCGAPAPTESTRCDHCGTPLATVACPSCFATIFIGAKFCSHCGARADRGESAGPAPAACPRCRAEMKAVVIGGAGLSECPRCGGIWADTSSFQQICADRERQSAVLGMATEIPAAPSCGAAETVRYVPCPRCRKLMNRLNFARCSGVIVDVCKAHGTWFDHDELRRIVEFIRAGGLDVSRAREIADLEERKRELEAAEAARAAGARAGESAFSDDDRHLGITSARGLLDFLLK
jgi:Zn-finger nucleic acid-binding protein